MRKRFFGLALSPLLFTLCFSASAQQPTKVPRIGFLLAVPPSTISARIQAFREGLRPLGYVEGKNIVIEWRSSEGRREEMSGSLPVHIDQADERYRKTGILGVMSDRDRAL